MFRLALLAVTVAVSFSAVGCGDPDACTVAKGTKYTFTRIPVDSSFTGSFTDSSCAGDKGTGDAVVAFLADAANKGSATTPTEFTCQQQDSILTNSVTFTANSANCTVNESLNTDFGKDDVIAVDTAFVSCDDNTDCNQQFVSVLTSK